MKALTVEHRPEALHRDPDGFTAIMEVGGA